MTDDIGEADRHTAFGPKKRERFLDALAEHCNVRRAANLAPVSKSTAYRNYRRDPAFAAQWTEALAQGYARLEEKLLAHALRALDEAEGEQASGETADAGDAARPRGEDGRFNGGKTALTDIQIALALLNRHQASVAGGGMAPMRAGRWRSTPESADAALRRQLDLLAKRLEKEDAAEAAKAKGRKA